MGKGMTSKQFIRDMESSEKGFSDANVTGMTQAQFVELASTAKTVSNFAKKLKKQGHTEFSTAWGTKILIDANHKMSEVAGLLEKLAGGIDDQEQAAINSMARARAKKDLRYIA